MPTRRILKCVLQTYFFHGRKKTICTIIREVNGKSKEYPILTNTILTSQILFMQFINLKKKNVFDQEPSPIAQVLRATDRLVFGYQSKNPAQKNSFIYSHCLIGTTFHKYSQRLPVPNAKVNMVLVKVKP